MSVSVSTSIKPTATSHTTVIQNTGTLEMTMDTRVTSSNMLHSPTSSKEFITSTSGGSMIEKSSSLVMESAGPSETPQTYTTAQDIMPSVGGW